MNATRTIALFEEGRGDEARPLAEAGFELALEQEDDVGRSQYALALGLIGLDSGDATDCVRRFREAELVQQRRTKAGGDAAQGIDGPGDELFHVVDLVPDSRRKFLDPAGKP